MPVIADMRGSVGDDLDIIETIGGGFNKALDIYNQSNIKAAQIRQEIEQRKLKEEEQRKQKLQEEYNKQFKNRSQQKYIGALASSKSTSEMYDKIMKIPDEVKTELDMQFSNPMLSMPETDTFGMAKDAVSMYNTSNKNQNDIDSQINTKRTAIINNIRAINQIDPDNKAYKNIEEGLLKDNERLQNELNELEQMQVQQRQAAAVKKEDEEATARGEEFKANIAGNKGLGDLESLRTKGLIKEAQGVTRKKYAELANNFLDNPNVEPVSQNQADKEISKVVTQLPETDANIQEKTGGKVPDQQTFLNTVAQLKAQGKIKEAKEFYDKYVNTIQW